MRPGINYSKWQFWIHYLDKGFNWCSDNNSSCFLRYDSSLWIYVGWHCARSKIDPNSRRISSCRVLDISRLLYVIVIQRHDPDRFFIHNIAAINVQWHRSTCCLRNCNVGWSMPSSNNHWSSFLSCFDNNSSLFYKRNSSLHRILRFSRQFSTVWPSSLCIVQQQRYLSHPQCRYVQHSSAIAFGNWQHWKSFQRHFQNQPPKLPNSLPW